MTDFFADLERQLVHATPARRSRIRRARARRAAALSAILLALVAGGAGLSVAVNGGERAGTSAGTAPVATGPEPTVPATPSGAPALTSFTTAVLNGTTTPGLGRAVANAVQSRGGKIGNVTNAATQDVTQTQVFYAPGRQIEAGKIAHAIGLRGELALMPITKAQRAIAGRQAKVVVLVGADQSTSPTP